MKNFPFEFLIKIMLIADKKECAKTSQFFYESFRLSSFRRFRNKIKKSNPKSQIFGMLWENDRKADGLCALGLLIGLQPVFYPKV